MDRMWRLEHVTWVVKAARRMVREVVENFILAGCFVGR